MWLASLREQDALSSIISALGLDGFIHLSAVGRQQAVCLTNKGLTDTPEGHIPVLSPKD